jgi:tRNA(fMet)-specific endonuclease VapC
MGRDLGKNDAWIAAIVSVQRAVLLTTDKDFGHLHPEVVEVEYVDPEQLAAGAI